MTTYIIIITSNVNDGISTTVYKLNADKYLTILHLIEGFVVDK